MSIPASIGVYLSNLCAFVVLRSCLVKQIYYPDNWWLSQSKMLGDCRLKVTVG